MDKILRYSTMLLVSVLALALGSCTDEYEYSGAKAEGEQVYFSNSLSPTVELALEQSSFQIPVNRIEKNGELTLPITVTKSDNSMLTIPTSVTFADGETVAYLTIGYDNSLIEYGKYEEVTLTVADAEYTTPYGASSYTFNAGMSEWKTMSGKAWYREGLVSSLYGSDPLLYQVDIQENVVTPGIYRLVEPYGPETNFYKSYVTTGDFDYENEHNTYIVIDATDPDYVYVSEDFYPGTKTDTEGLLHVFSFVQLYLNAGNSLSAIKSNVPELFGKLEDGVITMPANNMVCNFDETLNGQYYANANGMFAVALPGYEITDYTSMFTYKGHFTDVANNEYAVGNITLGADVASAKYIVAADGDDVSAIIAGINDGSIEATDIKESCEVSIPLEESGDYVMIIVTYDAAGNMKGSSATTFKFTIGSANSTVNWIPLYTGTFTYNANPNYIIDENEQYVGSLYEGSSEAVMYVNGDDNTTYRIYPWANSEDGLIFTLNEQGIISFKDVDTGETFGQYGSVYASDFNTKENVGRPTSGVADDNLLVFGTVYYVNAGYLAGADETFEVTGQASQSPMSAKIIENRNGFTWRHESVKMKKSIKRTKGSIRNEMHISRLKKLR